MHCPTYPPANYYAPYSQHPQDMCYSPQYQTYYPPKVYPSSYRRYVTPSGTYYQPTPNEMYEPPPAPAQSQQPPSNQQIVPTGPQHMEHYPPYYSGYSPGGGPGGCYNRSMQPPYIGKQKYDSFSHSFLLASVKRCQCVLLFVWCSYMCFIVWRLVNLQPDFSAPIFCHIIVYLSITPRDFTYSNSFHSNTIDNCGKENFFFSR